jgi:hypothetical protein
MKARPFRPPSRRTLNRPRRNPAKSPKRRKICPSDLSPPTISVSCAPTAIAGEMVSVSPAHLTSSANQTVFQIERKKLMEARKNGETPEDFDVASVSSNSDGDEQDKRKRASLFQAIAQCIANRWKALPSDERVKFEELAKEEMRKYRVKKDEYQQKMVRETLDLSNRSGTAASALPSAVHAGIPPGLYPHGLLGAPMIPGTGLAMHAPAMGLLGAHPSLALSLGGDRLFGGTATAGLFGQDPRLANSLQLPGGAYGLDRLLALRALQGDAGLRGVDPALLQQGALGSLGGLGGAVDLRLLGGGLDGGAAVGNQAARAPEAPASASSLSELPQEELLRLLQARQGAQSFQGRRL